MILILYLVSQAHNGCRKDLSHVEPDTPDCADLTAGQGRKKTADNRRISRLLPRIQDRTTGEDVYLYLMVLVERHANVDIIFLRLTNENFGRVCGRNKAHQACERF